MEVSERSTLSEAISDMLEFRRAGKRSALLAVSWGYIASLSWPVMLGRTVYCDNFRDSGREIRRYVLDRALQGVI